LQLNIWITTEVDVMFGVPLSKAVTNHESEEPFD